MTACPKKNGVYPEDQQKIQANTIKERKQWKEAAGTTSTTVIKKPPQE
jgi:hypothetical protein